VLLTVEKILYTFTTQVSLKNLSRVATVIDSAIFAQLTAESYTSQWAAPPKLKIAPSHGGSGPPSDTWFPGPTPLNILNGISTSSAIFAQVIAQCPTFYNRAPLSPSKLPLHLADLDPM